MANAEIEAEPANKKDNKVTGKAKKTTRKKTPSATKQKKDYHIDIFHAWCKQCGICIAFCPVGVLSEDDAGYPYAAKPESCIGCMQCELRCPDFAITVVENIATGKERTSDGDEGVGPVAAGS